MPFRLTRIGGTVEGFATACLLAWLLSAGVGQAAGARPLLVTGADGTSEFQVEIAVSAEQRSRGLMSRRSLADDAGMIFDFGTEQPITMWMRNTYVSLDMIFIHEDGTIGHIAADTTPLSDTVIPSRVEARFVLEVGAGTSRRLGIETGDRVHGPAIDDLR